MRYQCNRCDKWVKDKFIFGLVHVCISDEEYAQREVMKRQLSHRCLVPLKLEGSPGGLIRTLEDLYGAYKPQNYKEND